MKKDERLLLKSWQTQNSRRNFEFYGEDAKRVSELLSSKLLEKETALGKVEVSGFPREQWVSQAMKLWKQGESVYLSGQQEDGTHAKQE